MADPKTPFWKKGIQGIFTTKHPILGPTRTPHPLAVVITPEKTITFQGQKQTLEQMKQRYIKAGMRVSEKDLKTTFTNAWKQEQGTYKRLKPKRKPINYNTMKETSKWMNTKPTKQNFWQRRAANTKFNPKTGIKLLKIGKSLTPLGLGGTALWYAASKAYDPERVKKSKTQWGIK